MIVPEDRIPVFPKIIVIVAPELANPAFRADMDSVQSKDRIHIILCAAFGIVGAFWLLIFFTVVEQHRPKQTASGSSFSDGRSAIPPTGKAEASR
jgi:hypothetical protein